LLLHCHTNLFVVRYQPNLLYDRLVKRQQFLAQQVKEASSVALILANPADPSVQMASKHARKLLLARPNPPKVYTLAVGKPNPAKLANFQVRTDIFSLLCQLKFKIFLFQDIEVFVLLACPNNALLSPSNRQTACKEYYRPIVGLGEIELALNVARSHASADYKEIIEGLFVDMSFIYL